MRILPLQFRFFSKSNQLLRLLCFPLAAFFTITAAADNQNLTSLEAYLHETKAVLTDLTESPAKQEQTRADLKARLQQTTNPSERAQILLVMASDAMLYRQNVRASIPLWTESRALFKPGSEGWIQATLGLAIAEQNKMPSSPETIREAELLYQSVIAHDPDSSIAARSLFNIGRIAEVIDYSGDIQDHPKAREAYKTVYTRWPGQPIAHEAALRYGNTYLQEAYYPPTEHRNDWQWRTKHMHAGIDFLTDWVTRHPDAPLAPGIWEIIGNSFLLMPDYANWKEQALKAYLHSTGDQALLLGGEPVPHKTNMDRVDAGYLYLRIAALAQQTGNRPAAFEYYTRLMTEADSYQRGPEAALQLMHNLGFSRKQVIERARWQLSTLGYGPQEAQRIIEEFEFLDPPAGIPVPSP